MAAVIGCCCWLPSQQGKEGHRGGPGKANGPSSGGEECTGRGIEASDADHAKANKLVADIRGHRSRHTVTELVVWEQGEARMLKKVAMLNVMRAKEGKCAADAEAAQAETSKKATEQRAALTICRLSLQQQRNRRKML